MAVGIVDEPEEPPPAMAHEIVEWSPSQGWLALASYGGGAAQINFFTSGGQKTEGVPLARTCRATVIEWHPTEPILAVGWEDGALTATTPSRAPEETLIDLNLSEIVCLRFSCDGAHLCVVDSNGLSRKGDANSWKGVFFLGAASGDIYALAAAEPMKTTINIISSVAQLYSVETKSMLIALGDDMIVWDLFSEENFTLALAQQQGFDSNDNTSCVTYSRRKGMISAGTCTGKVATWRKRSGGQTGVDGWKLQGAVILGPQIVDLKWCPTSAALAVNTGADITILQEDHNIVHFHNKVAGMQLGQNHFTLIHVLTGTAQELKLPFLGKGIHIAEKQLVVWSDDTVNTYDVQTSLATFQASSFQCSAQVIGMANQALYCLERDKINVRTLQGTLKQVMSLPEMEGDPVSIDVNGIWMAVGSTNGFVRIYDLRGREAKQEYHAKYVVENVADFFRFTQVKVNATGTKVACTFLETMNELSDKVLIWDAEADTVGYFSLYKGMTDQQEYEAEAEASLGGARPQTAAARKMEKEKMRFSMPCHKPGQIHWDASDSRFLVTEAIYQNPELGDNFVISMFATAEHGIQMHDVQQKSLQCDALMGVQVPFMFFIKKSEYEEEEVRHEKTVGRMLIARTMKEFADVASLCLGHMGLARAARALRRSQRQGDPPEVQCATLAIQIGMIDEAQALYASAGRYDLLNKMLQAQNAWAPAFEIADKKDRIHLRHTHYNYATYLESVGAIEAAVEHYEKSGTNHFEVPRMYGDNPKVLENYVRRKRDVELQRWWARYLESIGELDGAMNFYAVAGDHLSVVRIKSLQGKNTEAAKIASDSNDRAACYHMGRTYEADGQFEQSVDFYTNAHAFSSAIRLAREHDMRDKLANLSLMAGGTDLIETAKYYEDLPGHAHRAVMLYHKAGMVGRALDLAFRTEQFSALDLITKDLNTDTDSSTLKRAAEFFASNQNFEKAVELLCFAKEFQDAINMCSRRNVRMSERLAELMTPTKENTPDLNARKRMLESVAELCLNQGQYAFAAKKYTQAGDKESAMRALIKSGDAAKVRFFATTARSKGIYILAANFLQTTDWRGDADIMRDIENFYGKAQSQEHLANFYIACAQMEIEDYRDFGKAGDALGEAEKSINVGLQKAPNAALQELQNTTRKFRGQLEKFQTIKGVYETDTTDAVRQLTTLAEDATEDDLIRPSHIFSLLIGHHAGKQSWTAAHRCILQLKKQQPNLDLTTVVPEDVLDKVCDEVGAERVTAKAGPTGAESDDDGEQIEFSHAMQRRNR
ncbi:unnamed protein product, partial [Mesorhabditis spiculigera]